MKAEIRDYIDQLHSASKLIKGSILHNFCNNGDKCVASLEQHLLTFITVFSSGVSKAAKALLKKNIP